MFYFICGTIFVNSLRAGTLCICDAIDIVAAGRFYESLTLLRDLVSIVATGWFWHVVLFQIVLYCC
jgi:hypothetical protein